MAESGKEQKIHAVADAALRILALKGMEAVNFSAVSRSAGVSRSWIYKYIGSSPEDLIRFSADYLGKMIIQMDRPLKFQDADSWKKGKLSRLMDLQKNTQRYTWFVPIYFRFRDKDNQFGRTIRDVEDHFIESEAAEICRLTGMDRIRARDLSRLLTTLRMGLAFRWQNGECLGKREAKAWQEQFTGWLERILAGDS